MGFHEIYRTTRVFKTGNSKIHGYFCKKEQVKQPNQVANVAGAIKILMFIDTNLFINDQIMFNP